MARIKDQRTVPIALVVIAALFVVARVASWWFASQEEAPAGMHVRWVPLEQAEAVARRTGKPILYDFTAEWCAPCHVLDEKVFRNPELAPRINQAFVPVRVTDRRREDGKNSPEVQALQDRFGIESFPTVVFADAAGTVREKMVGFRNAATFERLMERAR